MMLRSYSAIYKTTNNEVAIATTFVSGNRTRRRDTFLVPMLCITAIKLRKNLFKNNVF